jgi:acyl-CoA thioesterase FadM
MDMAEHELMRSLGFPYATTLHEIAFPRVHVSCDLRGAVRYDDQLTIEARVEQVGRSSWTVAFRALPLQVAGEAHSESASLLAEGKLTIVAMDPVTERSRSLPAELRAALSGETAVSESQSEG